MKKITAVIVIINTIFLSQSVFGSQSENGTVTLPLKEIIRLNLLEKDSKKIVESLPPATYTIESLSLNTRLLDEAIDVRAQFSLSVLVGEWVKIKLLDLGSSVQIIDLPKIDRAYFKVEDNNLMFISKHKGRYEFPLRFIKTATKEKKLLNIKINQLATMAKMNLEYDVGLFELHTPKIHRFSGSQTLYAEKNVFHLQWQRRGDVKRVDTKVKQQPVAPLVKTAHASVVATLSGERIFRIQYQLRFTGEKEFVLDLSKTQVIEQIFLNTVPVPFKLKDGQVTLLVTPQRVGDETATLELLMREHNNAYHLSGKLTFDFPKVSWSVNDFYVRLHLPKVFNYVWTGGTLAPNKHLVPAKYNFDIPTPGKSLEMHEQLITHYSNVRLEYTVDLTGRYFTANNKSFMGNFGIVESVEANDRRNNGVW